MSSVISVKSMYFNRLIQAEVDVYSLLLGMCNRGEFGTSEGMNPVCQPNKGSSSVTVWLAATNYNMAGGTIII